MTGEEQQPVSGEEQQEQQQHRFLVAGATGAIGRKVVHFAAKDDRVSSVTALVRGDAPESSEFYDLAPDSVAAAKIQHQKVDYNHLDSSSLSGHTVGVSAIGRYFVGTGSYEELEMKPSVAIASAAAEAGVRRWGVLSGAFTTPKATSSFFTPSKFYSKMRIEYEAGHLGFERAISARPMAIFGRSTGSLSDRVANWAVFRWAAHTPFGIRADAVARSLVEGVLTDDEGSLGKSATEGVIGLENGDMKRISKEVEGRTTGEANV